MAGGVDRLRVPSARGVRVERVLDRGPEEDAVPRLHEEHDAERLRGRRWATRRRHRTADFIIPNMVAEAASGSKTPKEAAERAQKGPSDLAAAAWVLSKRCLNQRQTNG